jgi:hypothetical protein
MIVAISTSLHPLKQAKGTEATAQAITQLLTYCGTPTTDDAMVRYHAINMQLHLHSSTAYLSESQFHSCTSGNFFLSSQSANASTAPNGNTMAPAPYNGTIHTHCSIMKPTLVSATETKHGALFFNAKDDNMTEGYGRRRL